MGETITPKYSVTRVFKRNWDSKARYTINRGGTRSSKTYSICQQFVNWLFTGQFRGNEYIPKGNANIVRRYSTTIQDTVQIDIDEILNTTYDIKSGEPLISFLDINKTKKRYSFGDRHLRLRGADDPQKIRGFKSDILYCNEANELKYTEEFQQLRMRCSGPIILDFNPSDPYIWINEELELKAEKVPGGLEVIVSTYHDNRFLSQEQINEIESMEDPELRKVYVHGQYGRIQGLIYPDFKVINAFPEQVKKFAYGIDYGYSSDPTVLGKFGIQNERDLFGEELLCSPGLDTDAISDLLTQHCIRGVPIYAESAETRLNAELKARGHLIIPVSKGPGSVNAGINLLRSFNHHVTGSSVNAKKEYMKYKYKEGTTVPIKGNDHYMDALRYYALSALGNTKKYFGYLM